VLVGADGVFGDIVVGRDVDPEMLTSALPELVPGLEITEWDRETTEAFTIGPAFRRRMAGPRGR
jgi:hypothetical protein